ncbi:MAG: SGNH/GDSL hydrolase family protein [Paludibacter sp.]|nr:SGNH/GDSL hydrolase family protein [Paludibacter sp.]
MKTHPSISWVKTLVIISFWFISNHCFAQQKPPFQKGDRVCFVGNSITHNGEFHHNILLYQITHFPSETINVYNCGVAGDDLNKVLSRLNDDIFVHRPNKVVIMIGMNDVLRSLYGNKKNTNADTLARRENALAKYKTKLDSLVRIFLSKNIQVILQKPSIYDQTADLKQYNNLGVNDALKICADYAQTLADKYKLQTVDYWSIMTEKNRQLQQKNASATIVGPDRVHPGAVGHFVMAYQFIKMLSGQKPQYVSRICIGKSKKYSNRKSENCSIQSFLKNKNTIIFNVQEYALPFPIVEKQLPALEIIPFTKEYNSELLLVNGLTKMNYKLLIDSAYIGNFTASQLKSGLNLATFQNTPHYQQSLRVKELLTDVWKIEEGLRAIKMLEYWGVAKLPYLENIDTVRVKLEKMRSKSSSSNWFIKQYQLYVDCKPMEEKLKLKSDSLIAEAFLAAKPKVHNYKIESIK